LEGGINLFVYVDNNPASGIDPLGLFANHDVLSSVAFNKEKLNDKKLVSEAVRGAVKADVLTDSQLPVNARWHAMSNGDENESTESARRNTEDYITEQLNRCNGEGLGRALHAEQDKYAGGHRGYQPWHRKGGRVKHWWKDYSGGGEAEAVAASIALIQRFKEICSCARGK
jgi:hypothetical protein